MSSPRRRTTRSRLASKAVKDQADGPNSAASTSTSTPTGATGPPPPPPTPTPAGSTVTTPDSESDLAYFSPDEEPPRTDFDFSFLQAQKQEEDPLASTFHSVLSPRRSSRLKDKLLKDPFTPTPTSTVPTESINDFYFFRGGGDQDQKNTSVDNTSDYGTSSICSTKKLSNQVSDILSDEISNMSLDDVVPSQLNELPSQNIRLLSMDNHHFLLPANNGNNQSQIPAITYFEKMTAEAVAHFANFDKVITPACPVFKVSNFNPNPLQLPIIVVPISLTSDFIQIYCLTNDSWTPTDRFKLSLAQAHVGFFFQPNIYYLVVAISSQITRRVIIQANRQTVFKLSDRPTKISLRFPKNSVDEPTETRAILVPSQLDLNQNQIIYHPLASFILSLTPHGIVFNHPVTIQIEIMHFREIMAKFPMAKLIVFQSDDGFNWTDMPDFRFSKNNTVEFEVQHFSFFKVVWDMLSHSLTSAKLGISTLWTSSLPMKCQSTMDEFENNRFGLEVSIYRSDKAFPEVQNYNHIVGRSLPKLVKPGKLTIALKSKLFGPDTDAGEVCEMVKEDDFKGQDVCKDFALKFNSDVKIERGPFGKVLVTRKISSNRAETIFEFNIQKQGNENENSAEALANSDNRDRWSTMALQELATSLFITDGENWKLFAKNIGFTKQEIKLKFKDSADPFRAIIESYKTRGGTPEEFINSLYEIHREIKINSNCGSPNSFSSRKSANSTNSSGLGSSLTDRKYKRKNVRLDKDDMEVPNDDDDDDDEGHNSPGSSQITSDSVFRAKRAKGNPPNLRRKRRKFSEIAETFSPSDEADESSSENEHIQTRSHNKQSISTHSSSNASKAQKLDQTKLSSTYLWNLSANLTNSSWKALGRTLQLDEACLINIEQIHKPSGNRECYYQVLVAWKEQLPKKCTFGNLYIALKKENLAAVAKTMQDIGINKPF